MRARDFEPDFGVVGFWSSNDIGPKYGFVPGSQVPMLQLPLEQLHSTVSFLKYEFALSWKAVNTLICSSVLFSASFIQSEGCFSDVIRLTFSLPSSLFFKIRAVSPASVKTLSVSLTMDSNKPGWQGFPATTKHMLLVALIPWWRTSGISKLSSSNPSLQRQRPWVHSAFLSIQVPESNQHSET